MRLRHASVAALAAFALASSISLAARAERAGRAAPAPSADAETVEATPAAPASRPFTGSVGLKSFFGGNLLTSPTNVPITPPHKYTGDAGGFGWGIGLALEGRLYKHFGVEIDFIRDESTLQRDATLNNVFKYTEKTVTTSTRVPILFKVIAPLSAGRFWFGVGPEFVSGGSASGSVDVNSGAQYVNPQSALETLKASNKAEATSYTNLDLAAGGTIDLPSQFEITFDLRAAHNLSQSTDWASRVKDSTPAAFAGDYHFQAANTWDFRLAIGAGYRF